MRLLKRKQIPAIGLAAFIVLAAVFCAHPRVWAAERVDMTRRGTLTLELASDDSDEMRQDMARIEEPVPVYAWKLADMQESGNYAFLDAFEGLASAGELTGDSWKKLTEDAMARIFQLDEEGKPVGEPLVAPDRIGSIQVMEDGKQTETSGFDDMDLGLYLVLADNVRSPKYEYSFNPMIVSLPWSEYQYLEGSGSGEGNTGDGEVSDEWQYSRQAVMKPARELLYGKVRIVKTLSSYNAAQGEVTFVFDVTAREDQKVVYSNVFSATFSAAGTQEIIIEHIPAEAEVTVTEIYSGANCTVIAADRDSKVVLADALDGSNDPVTFRFENAYDEEGKRGYGVENRFRYNAESDTYEWTTDRSDIQGIVE